MTKTNNFFSSVKFWTKQHTPEILVGTSIVSGVAAVVLGCVATYKYADDFKKAKKNIEKVKNEYPIKRENPELVNIYSEEEEKKEISRLKKNVVKKYIKAYYPTAICLGMSVASILGATKIQKGRELAVATAYAALKSEYDKIKTEGITIGDTKEENKEEKQQEEVKIELNDKLDQVDLLHFWYDESCPSWEPDATLNVEHILQTEKYLNEKLRRNGYLFVEDVYKHLGINLGAIPTAVLKASKVIGWIYDMDNPNGSNYVSLGLTQGNGVLKQNIAEQVRFGEPSFLLEINPDGDILTGGPNNNKRTFVEKARGW